MTHSEIVSLVRARTLAATGEGRRRRLAAGLSLKEVANAIGGSASTIHRWERAERRPHGAAAVRWAELLEALTKSAAA